MARRGYFGGEGEKGWFVGEVDGGTGDVVHNLLELWMICYGTGASNERAPVITVRLSDMIPVRVVCESP